jgi:bifunctional non-homologous end joining protein LigD
MPQAHVEKPRVPYGRDEALLTFAGGARVRLTNLRQLFWPDLGVTKGMLVQYYLDIAAVLLPHVIQRAMVMKRWPNGIAGKFFFMKRAPAPRPPWIATCTIEHASEVIELPVVNDVASLAWIINLGCIDLNPWYARCDDVDRPDYLHFDLDPGTTSFARVREAALVVHETLSSLAMPSYAKTSGSSGMHVYVPIVRGPRQHDVWVVAKAIATELARRHPKLLTAEYRVARRPEGRVVVDYNQNAWGRTLASVYSVRPTGRATVSMPVTWAEVADEIATDDFRIDNALARIRRRGDLWAPLAPSETGRFDLARLAP